MRSKDILNGKYPEDLNAEDINACKIRNKFIQKCTTAFLRELASRTSNAHSDYLSAKGYTFEEIIGMNEEGLGDKFAARKQALRDAKEAESKAKTEALVADENYRVAQATLDAATIAMQHDQKQKEWEPSQSNWVSPAGNDGHSRYRTGNGWGESTLRRKSIREGNFPSNLAEDDIRPSCEVSPNVQPWCETIIRNEITTRKAKIANQDNARVIADSLKKAKDTADAVLTSATKAKDELKQEFIDAMKERHENAQIIANKAKSNMDAADTEVSSGGSGSAPEAPEMPGDVKGYDEL